MDRPLKAYAAKRRQDAGAPLELHPATRRMLQAEAARQAPGTRGEALSWTRLLIGWLPRLAGAAVLCTFLGLIGWALFQPDVLRRENNLAQLSRDEFLLADNFQPEAPATDNKPLTAPLDRLAPAAKPAPIAPILAARPAEASAAKEDSFGKAASLSEAGATSPNRSQDGVVKLAKAGPDKDANALGGGLTGGAGTRALKSAVTAQSFSEAERFSQTTATDRRRAEAATAPQNILLADQATDTLAAKAKSVEPTKSVSLGLNLVVGPPSAAPAPAPAAAPAQRLAAMPESRARGAVTSSLAAAPTQAQYWSFQQLPALVEARADARKKSGAASVLTSFSWQQSGKQLRVVDADGSVYLGEAQESANLGPASSPSTQRGFKPIADAPPEKRPAPVPQTQAAGTFRVSGTNQTLRQRVVFSGQLLRESWPGGARDLELDTTQRGLRPAALSRGGAPQPTAAAQPPGSLPANAAQNAAGLLRIEAQATLGDGRVLPIRAIGR